jgi:hypothetical protein
MTRFTRFSLLLVSLAAGAAACGPRKSNDAEPGAPSPPAPRIGENVSEATPPPALPAAGGPIKKVDVGPEPLVLGMEEPFFNLGPTGWKTLKSGWRAMGKKDYAGAREAFAAVVSAYPDHTEVRFQELRAAVLGGELEAVPALWRGLLARDYVGFAGRLDRSKEMAPLRASPLWAELQVIRTEAARRHGSGLGKGIPFVARAGGITPELAEGSGEVKLALGQEAFHFDPVSKRMRRLTDTGGQVLGIQRDGAGKRLMLLTAGAVKQGDGQVVFTGVRAGLLSLETGERLGSFAIEGEPSAVELCFSDKDEPVWVVRATGADSRPLTIESTGTSLVAHEQGCSETVAVTRVTPTGVEHQQPAPEGIALSDDGLQLTGVDGDRAVRASQAIRPGSLGWSPGKKRFVYTGKLDRCQAHQQVVSGLRPVPNAVYVWDSGEKKAARVKSAVASLQAEWLDDDQLVYEAEKGGTPQVVVHDLRAEGPVLTLDVPAGAGLYGIPALPCPEVGAHAFNP